MAGVNIYQGRLSVHVDWEEVGPSAMKAPSAWFQLTPELCQLKHLVFTS